MKDQKPKKEVPKETTDTFYRLKRISKFEYAVEAVEVPSSWPKSEPLKRNLRGIVIARLTDLFEK